MSEPFSQKELEQISDVFHLFLVQVSAKENTENWAALRIGIETRDRVGYLLTLEPGKTTAGMTISDI